jgi:hypothetical protein
VAPPAPRAEGEPEPDVAPRSSYADALRDLASQKRLAKEPSAIALASVDCTFRDLEMPFTSADQIGKVIKFEAESHLQLVEIDSVVVSYQVMDSDGKGGSRVLATACSKDQIRSILRDLSGISVDPQFADLHLTAVYTALKATGYLSPPPPPAADLPPSEVDKGETLLVLECDPDLTHLLVARGDTLVAARAIRLALGVPKDDAAGEPAAEAAADAEGGAPASGGSRGDHHDETMVVVDDLGGEGGARGRRGGDYFARLKREVQRSLFRIGPAAETVDRVLVLGSATADPLFVERLERALALPVEVAKPYDKVEHDLDEEALALANAEGAAALGVAVRLLGYAEGSRVDFRQEEVRYARRFDQVKVALSSLAIVALVCVALLCIERAKEYKVKQRELMNAAGAVLGEYSQHADTLALTQQVNSGKTAPIDAVKQAKIKLEEKYNQLSSELGRSGSIPRLSSGLDYLNAIISAFDAHLQKIGRIEISSLDLAIGRDRDAKPQLKMRMFLTSAVEVDAMIEALRSSPAVKSVQIPTTVPAKDGRLEVSNLEVDLVPDFDPRRAAKKEVRK